MSQTDFRQTLINTRRREDGEHMTADSADQLRLAELQKLLLRKAGEYRGRIRNVLQTEDGQLQALSNLNEMAKVYLAERVLASAPGPSGANVVAPTTLTYAQLFTDFCRQYGPYVTAQQQALGEWNTDEVLHRVFSQAWGVIGNYLHGVKQYGGTGITGRQDPNRDIRQ